MLYIVSSFPSSPLLLILDLSVFRLRSLVSEADDEDNRSEASSLLWVGRNAQSVEKQTKMVKAAFYALQVFYSFFIM